MTTLQYLPVDLVLFFVFIFIFMPVGRQQQIRLKLSRGFTLSAVTTAKPSPQCISARCKTYAGASNHPPASLPLLLLAPLSAARSGLALHWPASFPSDSASLSASSPVSFTRFCFLLRFCWPFLPPSFPSPLGVCFRPFHLVPIIYIHLQVAHAVVQEIRPAVHHLPSPTIRVE